MIQTKRLLRCILLLSILCHVACKKDSTIPKSKSELLTRQSWKLIAYQYNYDNLGWQDVFLNMSDCEKDNRLLFLPNLDYTINDNVIKCYSWDPQILREGTWSFDSNETKLIMKDTIISTHNLEIDVLDESTLKITKRDTFGSTIAITGITYTH